MGKRAIEHKWGWHHPAEIALSSFLVQELEGGVMDSDSIPSSQERLGVPVAPFIEDVEKHLKNKTGLYA